VTRRLELLCAAALAVLVVGLVGACTPGTVKPLPPAPKVALTTTTVAIDYGAIGLAGVPGRTTTTVAMGPGKATLAGVVNGPDGPVPGAVVHAERIVGDAMASTDLLTQADGTFQIPAVLGGRYRVRAWKPAPDNLALVEPQVFFLEGSENKKLTIGLTRYAGVAVTAAVAPDPPLIDAPTNLVVQVVDQSVDGGGIVRSQPVPGITAELFGSGDWRLTSANPTTTDAAGRARWQLECRRVGQQPLSVVVGDTSTFNLNLSGCTVPPPTGEETDPTATSEAPATTAPAATTTAKPATTTTTARPTTTTSTTARPPGTTTTTR
jgi:hypothetical protein